MNDDILNKFRQVTEIFGQNFQSDEIQKHNRTYLENLYKQLSQWKSNIDNLTTLIVEEKAYEIQQFYGDYCQEAVDKYDSLNNQIEDNDTFSNKDDQIENFNIYCQSNTIEKRICLMTTLITKQSLDENIRLEYIPHHDIPLEQAIIPLKIVERDHKVSVHTIDYSSDASRERKAVISKRQDPAYAITTSSDSPPSSETDCQRPTKLIVTIRTSTGSSPERTPTTKKRPRKHRAVPKMSGSSREDKPFVREPIESIHDTNTLSEVSPTALVSENKSSVKDLKVLESEHENISKPSNSCLKKELFVSQNKPTQSSTNKASPKESTKLYIGKSDAYVPILVHKGREIYNEKEKIIEYCIDSVVLPNNNQEEAEQQLQLTNLHDTNNKESSLKLVHAYRVLVEDGIDFHPLSSDDEDEKSKINYRFDLQRFNQDHYSTMAFKQCETEHNCISSSTKDNELLIYNSKLNILINLKYEQNRKCRNQLFIQWPERVSSKISDIIYCENHDQYLISTLDTRHIYLFDPNLLSIKDLGKLAKDLPLRRLHCYRKKIYCTLGHNVLVEFELDERISKLKFIRQIKVFTPTTRSEDTIPFILDVSCDENYLIIIYSNENDEIHLQMICRDTGKFYNDFLLNKPQPINKSSVRIESTNQQGHFIYLNGSKDILTSIDLSNGNRGKITSVMHRQKKLTNVTFLKDGRLVILYEYPHYISIHDSNTH